MKQPKLGNLKIDVQGTKALRSKIHKAKKIKITINIDEDVLASLRGKAENTGIPYQSLLNRLLREAVEHSDKGEARLDRLEKELKEIKKKLSA